MATFKIEVLGIDHRHPLMRWYGVEVPAHPPNDLNKGPSTEYYTLPRALFPDDVQEGDQLQITITKGHPQCAGCGSPVVEEGDACHSCIEGTHDECDLQWLDQDAIKKIQKQVKDSKRRTHGFVMSTRNKQ